MASIFQETIANVFEARSGNRGTYDERIFDELDGFRIIVSKNNGQRIYLLIARSEGRLKVNGQFIVGSLRVLDHKDEILDGSNRYYFSAESIPQVSSYRGIEAGKSPRCPVCRGTIKDGDRVVACPGCQRVYHQIDTGDEQTRRHCWIYGPSCQFCGHPTSLSGENAWRPDEEGER